MLHYLKGGGGKQNLKHRHKTSDRSNRSDRKKFNPKTFNVIF